jgi:hypothetical protein
MKLLKFFFFLAIIELKMSLVTSTILTDYFINYVFPQYALPWNNFYTVVDSSPYGVRNNQRNSTAGAFHTPLDVNPRPFVYLLDHIPYWNDLSKQDNEGVVQDTVGTKQFLTKDVVSQSFYFQYSYSGSFVGLPSSQSTNWYVFLLNLANTNAGYIQNVAVKNVNNKYYSSLVGSISDNNGNSITIKNATPIVGLYAQNSLPSDSNTVYKIFGNRIFIAIENNNTINNPKQLTYSFQFLMQETPSISELSGFAVGIL